MRFLGFSNHEKGAPRQEISKFWTVCSTFSRSVWSVIRSSSPSNGGTSKKRPSPHLHKVPTRSNKVGLRTFQTAFVIYDGVSRSFRVDAMSNEDNGERVWSCSLIILDSSGSYVSISLINLTGQVLPTHKSRALRLSSGGHLELFLCDLSSPQNILACYWLLIHSFIHSFLPPFQ
jgi:hypothetical protein